MSQILYKITNNFWRNNKNVEWFFELELKLMKLEFEIQNGNLSKNIIRKSVYKTNS